MEEIIDYVDEQDAVLDKAPRSEVKNNQLNYRIVHIWVFNAKNQLLICKRPPKRKDYAGMWTSSAGGHVKAGESYEEAAHREAKEELGLDSSLQHLFKLKYHHPRGCFVFIDVWAFKNGFDLNDLTVDKEEIMEMRFALTADLEKEMISSPQLFSPQFIQLINQWNHLKEE